MLRKKKKNITSHHIAYIWHSITGSYRVCVVSPGLGVAGGWQAWRERRQVRSHTIQYPDTVSLYLQVASCKLCKLEFQFARPETIQKIKIQIRVN